MPEIIIMPQTVPNIFPYDSLKVCFVMIQYTDYALECRALNQGLSKLILEWQGL